jgi:hypothetical protein
MRVCRLGLFHRRTGNGSGLKQVALSIVMEPKSGTKAVIERRSTDTVLFKGTATGVTYVCGCCRSALIVGLDVKKFHDVVLKCNHCKAFNAVGQPL